MSASAIKILRNVTIAGAAGYLCGKGYKIFVARAHPDTVLPIVQLSAASGVAGAVVGWAVSAYRNLPTHIYTLSLGANFAITSAVFFSVRHGIMTSLESSNSSQPTPITLQQDGHGLQTHTSSSWYTIEHAQYVSSTAGGGIAGTLASIVSRHSFKSIMLTGIGGLVCGFCGQLLYNRIEVWRKKKAIEIHYPELSEQKEKSWTFESLQERFLDFWHQTSRTVEWDMQITLLEDAIRKERQGIAELDKALQECGVSVEVEGDHSSSSSSTGQDSGQQNGSSSSVDIKDNEFSEHNSRAEKPTNILTR